MSEYDDNNSMILKEGGNSHRWTNHNGDLKVNGEQRGGRWSKKQIVPSLFFIINFSLLWIF